MRKSNIALILGAAAAAGVFALWDHAEAQDHPADLASAPPAALKAGPAFDSSDQGQSAAD